MKVMPKAKQVRFAQLVTAAGRPHPATLWTEPTNDPEFKKAMEENRIVTVRNVNVGTKKDRGVIGFLKGPNSTYLIFPKALPMAEGSGVIGLKFDELAEEAVKDPVKMKTPARKIHAQKAQKPEERQNSSNKSKKGEKLPDREETKSMFKVRVAFTGTVVREMEVEANSASEAIRAAEHEAKAEPPAIVNWKVEGLEVKKVKS
jgi:hypothetical protein